MTTTMTTILSSFYFQWYKKPSSGIKVKMQLVYDYFWLDFRLCAQLLTTFISSPETETYILLQFGPRFG